MALTDARAYYGLTATGSLSRTGAAGIATVGTTQTPLALTNATIGYCVKAIIADSSSDFVLALTTGATTGTTAFVAGNAQLETATIIAASGATSNGTMTLVLTSDGMTGSPLNIDVALTTTAHTTAALIAAAARTALSANATVAARFTVGGTGADITLERIANTVSDLPLYYADDATINLAIPGGLGVTAAATSTSTTAGVASSGVKLYDEGVDFEGRSIATMVTVQGLLMSTTAESSAAIMAGGDPSGTIIGGGYLMSVNTTGVASSPITFQSDAGFVELTVTVIGAP
jgi:hypothetical protein